jgi:hypothetical protein
VVDGLPGVLGVGGRGGSATSVHAGGGGGGGGLYGGGGGGAAVFDAAAGGGGGSSLGDTSTAGVRAGNGQVTITPAGGCDTPTTTTVPEAPTNPPVAQPATAVAAKPTYTG